MLSSVNGFTMPFNNDAYAWGTEAAGTPYNYAVNSTPGLGSIYWSSPNDHVAYVEDISTDGSQVELEDYNAGYPTNPGQWAEYWTSTSSATGYIHFKDLNPGLGGGNASSFVANRVDAWIEQSAPSNGSNLGHVWFQNGTWNPWETIPASNELMTSQPAVVSWSANRIDVFARGQAGDLIHTWTDNPNNPNAWNPWASLGGCIIGSPTVTSWGVGRLDVFAEGCNSTGGNLWHIWYDTSVNPNNWQPWENIETSLVMTAPPSAVSWGNQRIDVLARGTDSSLMHTFYDGAWESVLSLGGCIEGSPAASAWAPQRLDVFVEGCNATGGNFYHTFWDGKWNSFDLVNSSYQVSGVLGAASWGYKRIDMFTRRSDNTLDHWWYDQNGWNGPDNRGGSLAS